MQNAVMIGLGLVGLLFLPSPSWSQDEVTITRTPLSGTWQATSHWTMEGQFKLGGRARPHRVNAKEVKTVEVLQATAKGVKKAKVHYAKKPEHGGALPHLLSGKTYVVEEEKEQVVVRTSTGGALKSWEQAMVRKDMPGFGRPLASFLPDSLTLKKSIALDNAQVLQLIDDTTDLQTGWKGEAQLVKATPKTLEFELKLENQGKLFGAPIENSFRGTLLVERATCLVQSAKLSGSWSAKGKGRLSGQEFMLEGGGTNTLEIKWEPLPASPKKGAPDKKGREASGE